MSNFNDRARHYTSPATRAAEAAAAGPAEARDEPKATPAQIGCVRALLHKLGLMEQKGALAMSFSEGRTESVSDLFKRQAMTLISHLKRGDPEEQAAEKMRRKIISMAHEMGWHIPGTQRVDMRRLDGWMEKSSYLHKRINHYSYAELPALVTQFEKVYESFLKGL